MMDINFLKSEMYKKEKRDRISRMFLYYFVAFFIVILSISSVSFNENEDNLMKKVYQQDMVIDSLKSFIVDELVILKHKENKIIRSALSLSIDTSYAEYNNLNDININGILKKQSLILDGIQKISSNKWDSIISVPCGLPIPSTELYRLSDDYGWRKHPIMKKWVFHDGVDLSAEIGSSVLSTSKGVVEVITETESGYGKRIVVNHGYGFKTLYAHLDTFCVNVGDMVKRGDVIGKVGSTGTSTGPHLHYEVLLDNKPINPQQYFYYGDFIAVY